MSNINNTTTMRDSAVMRWSALLLLAVAMFFAYIFMDILSPIKDLMESTRGWDSTAFGTYAGSETFLNVFIFFLIIAGIILDKMGVRFTALLSGAVMLLGACINWYAITEMFMGSALEEWFKTHLNYIPVFDELGVSPFYEGMPASAKFASIGFMIFGCGAEMAGITVSRGVVKWFKGKEVALAMGSEMALARLGVATCMIFSPVFAKMFGKVDVSRSAAFGLILLMIACIMFVVYFFMDKRLDAQTGEAEEKDDPFRLSDIGLILKSQGFWVVALLCVLYYSAIFPFQKYAVNMLQSTITFNELAPNDPWASNTVTVFQYLVMIAIATSSFISNFCKNKIWKYTLLGVAVLFLLVYCYMAYHRQSAEAIFAVFPLLAVGITPIKGNNIGGISLAFVTILILGASFSLVPASLWPSVPKLVDSKIIGSAYALIFWIQNIGLWLFPLLIGKVLKSSNPEVERQLAENIITPSQATTAYNYTNPLLMLAVLGLIALFLGFYLKIVDKKKGYGLEEPNVKE